MPSRREAPYGWRPAGGEKPADAVEQLVIGQKRAWHSARLTHGAIALRLHAGRPPSRDGRWAGRTGVAVVEDPGARAAEFELIGDRDRERRQTLRRWWSSYC